MVLDGTVRTDYFTVAVVSVLLLFRLAVVSCVEESKEGHSRSQSRSSTVTVPPLPTDAVDIDSQNEEAKGRTNSTPIAKYKYLFAQHRTSQLEAVKGIVSFGDDKQRYELISVMLKQLFKTLEGTKQNLTEWGHLPGDPFPENITVLEGMSKVLENTAMFGDMVLRLPDIVHDIYDREREWQLLLGWAYGFCTESGVFEGPNEQLLNLMAQEVGLIELQGNYKNPYKAVTQEKKKKFEEPKKKAKKQAKKIRRGPRLSHTEL